MPARRKRRRLRAVNNKKSNGLKRFKVFLVFIFIIILVVLFLKFNRKYWNNEDKLAIVIQADSGELIVGVFDPNLNEITTIDIPADTQLSVSRQLGNWKAKSLWNLSEDKKLRGKLLSESVMRYFHFPVYIWAGSRAEGLVSTSSISIVKSALYPVNTNLSLVDRIHIGLFALRIPNSRRMHIALEDTTYLRRSTLSDGSSGYKKTQSMPNTLLAVFSDPILAESEYRVSIIDDTGDSGVADTVGDVLSVLGAKLALVKKGEEKDYDCSVASSNKNVEEKIAKIFSCNKGNSVVRNSGEIELTLGKKFAERF